MGKVYLDAEELAEREIISVLIDGEEEVVFTGTTIQSMDVTFKKDYQVYEDLYDIHFIFEDNLPTIKFYTNPQVDIVAIDSLGGFIGAVGESFDIESSAPICYINQELECFLIAENAKEFSQNIASWRKNLKPYNNITFYVSKIEATQELRFIELPKGQIGEHLK